MPDTAHPLQTEPIILHASCVAAGDAGVLILGASGSGKSALALTLMAFGAQLVSDDRTVLTRPEKGGPLQASAPDTIRGKIEARGIGVLAAEPVESVPVRLAVDLDRAETARLPEFRTVDIGGTPVPLLHKVESGHFAPAILQYVRSGRLEPHA